MGEEGGTLQSYIARLQVLVVLGHCGTGELHLADTRSWSATSPLSSGQKGGGPMALGKALLGSLVVAQVAPPAGTGPTADTSPEAALADKHRHYASLSAKCMSMVRMEDS